jgi:hypothetical protein
LYWFTHTVPASSAAATRTHWLASAECRPAPSPYVVAFASATASASVSKRPTARTGPKICAVPRQRTPIAGRITHLLADL